MSKCKLIEGCAILDLLGRYSPDSAKYQLIADAVRRNEYIAVALHKCGLPLIVGVQLAEALLLAQKFPPRDCTKCGKPMPKYETISADAA